MLLRSRQGTDMTGSFPEVRTAALMQLPPGTGLDGELVVWETGRLAFERLQQRLARRGKGASEAGQRPAHYVTFDLLHQGDTDLTGFAYWRRRAALEALFAEHTLAGPLTLCPSTTDPAHAEQWLGWTAVGLEGLCFKRLDEPYRPVRSWKKYKVRVTHRGHRRCVHRHAGRARDGSAGPLRPR
ncbi:ATP-dependent DNA ligase [Streptomyces sp. NPDC017943]|uniref:ATP-dependent DNA ligase n=1 Tax=Streptomyces sp. NPDC017943 TaxID=3365019 RepID=UPI0037AFA610